VAKISGIYKIQSMAKPEKCYIGSSANIMQRWAKHLRNLRKNIHENRKLQNHYNKYGKIDLVFSILIGCDKEDLIPTEQFYLDSTKSWFNIRTKADSNLGLSPSIETRKKLSEALKGRPTWNKGLPAHNRGVPMSEEQKVKIRAARKLQVNTRKGVPHSVETKKRLSEINKGKRLSVEQRRKISDGLKGRKCSEETRRKISEANKGKHNISKLKVA